MCNFYTYSELITVYFGGGIPVTGNYKSKNMNQKIDILLFTCPST